MCNLWSKWYFFEEIELKSCERITIETQFKCKYCTENNVATIAIEDPIVIDAIVILADLWTNK